MHKDYYLEYFELERKNWWFTARREILKSQIQKLFSKKEKIKILNIGIATGASTEWLSEFGEVTSVEYDAEVCEYVRRKLGIQVHNASITDLPFPESSYDLVCAFDVVEHVEDDHQAVREMKRVCKEQGKIFITVPAFMHLWSEHDEINFHHRRYTLPRLRELVVSSGLDNILFQSYFNTFLYPSIWAIRMLGKLKNKKKDQSEIKSDFSKMNSNLLGRLFYHVFLSENKLLKSKIKFPFGVSILMIIEK